MSTEENKAIVRRHRLEMCGQGSVALADEIFADLVIASFQSSEQMEVDPDFFRQNVINWHKSFPDTRTTIERLVAEGDEVAEYWTWGGVHKGEFWGIAPTGKWAVVTGASFYRFVDGKIVEFRSVWDIAGLLEQLGVSALPG